MDRVIEIRSAPTTSTRSLIKRNCQGLELREARSAVAGSIGLMVGYAAVFNLLSEDLGGFREKIAPGAFKRAIESKADVRAVFNHSDDFLLGRVKSETLRMKEDEKGLWTETDLPDTQWGRDTQASIRRKDLDGMSFRFYMVKDTWEKASSGWTRTLLDLELFDVGPVTFPAYLDTSAEARSMCEADFKAATAKHREPLTPEARAKRDAAFSIYKAEASLLI